MHFLEYAEDYLREQFETLGDRNCAAMALVFMKNGLLRAPLSDLSHEDELALKLFNSNIGEVRKALKALDGPYIAKQIHNGETFYRFKHPTIRDGFGKFISSDPNLMDCYLQGTTTAMLLEEVTCGETSHKGGSLLIPPQRYSVVIKRLQNLLDDPDGKNKIVDFLNSKCSAEFLSKFTKEIPEFVESLSFDTWNMEWSPVTHFYAKLHEFKLLPENCREHFIRIAGERAVNSQHWRLVQHPNFRGLFRPSEVRKLRSKVLKKLTKSALNELINDWKEAWENSKDESAEDYFWSLSRQFDSLREEFCSNRRVTERFTSALEQIESVVRELDAEYIPREDSLEAESFEDNDTPGRSVFDDVDA